MTQMLHVALRAMILKNLRLEMLTLRALAPEDLRLGALTLEMLTLKMLLG